MQSQTQDTSMKLKNKKLQPVVHIFRYKFVMMEVKKNMITKMKMIVIVMMMNLLKMNYLTC